MRLITNLAGGAALIVLVGCESVTGPMPLSLANPPPAPVQASSVRIELRNLTATTSNPGPFFYSVKFVLANTDDVDGAEIQGVTVEADGGSQDYVIGCPPIRIYLAAGQTTNIFTNNALSYCSPGIESERALPEVKVTVFFVDDAGRKGTVSSTTRTVDLSAATAAPMRSIQTYR